MIFENSWELSLIPRNIKIFEIPGFGNGNFQKLNTNMKTLNSSLDCSVRVKRLEIQLVNQDFWKINLNNLEHFAEIV